MTKKGFVIDAIKFGGIECFNHVGLMLKAFLMAIVIGIVGFLIALIVIGIPLLISLAITTEQKTIFPLVYGIMQMAMQIIGLPLIYTAIEIGFLQIALDIIHHGYSNAKRMIITGITFWRIIGATCVSGVIALIGLMLFIIPGIIWIVRVQFFIPLMLDNRDLGISDALKKSWAMTKGYFWQLFLWNLLAYLLSFIFLILGFQFYALSEAYVYRYLLTHQKPIMPIV